MVRRFWSIQVNFLECEGFGVALMKDFVRNKLSFMRSGWVGLQEMKLRVVDCGVVRQVCGRGDWGFVFSAVVGAL